MMFNNPNYENQTSFNIENNKVNKQSMKYNFNTKEIKKIREIKS